MTIEESIEQLEGLVEAWQLDEADLNQTDINAIRVLLDERENLLGFLKSQLGACDYFISNLSKDIKKISAEGRAAGKTYLANQIANNSIAQKCYREVLTKMGEGE